EHMAGDGAFALLTIQNAELASVGRGRVVGAAYPFFHGASHHALPLCPVVALTRTRGLRGVQPISAASWRCLAVSSRGRSLRVWDLTVQVRVVMSATPLHRTAPVRRSGQDQVPRCSRTRRPCACRLHWPWRWIPAISRLASHS